MKFCFISPFLLFASLCLYAGSFECGAALEYARLEKKLGGGDEKNVFMHPRKAERVVLEFLDLSVPMPDRPLEEDQISLIEAYAKNLQALAGLGIRAPRVYQTLRFSDLDETYNLHGIDEVFSVYGLEMELVSHFLGPYVEEWKVKKSLPIQPEGYPSLAIEDLRMIRQQLETAWKLFIKNSIFPTDAQLVNLAYDFETKEIIWVDPNWLSSELETSAVVTGPFGNRFEVLNPLDEFDELGLPEQVFE